MRGTHLAPLAALALALAACGGSSGGGGSQGGGKLAQALQPAAPVKVQAATTQPFEHALTAYGTIEFATRGARIHDVQAEARVAEVPVTIGQPVKPGTLLVVLEPTPNSQLELQKAQIDLDFARKDLTRVKALYDEHLATNADLGNAQKGMDAAQATLENVRRRQVDERHRHVRATVRGVVIALDVKPGQVVPAGTELVRVGDQRRLDVRLGVEQEDLSSVHDGDPVEVRALNSPTRRKTHVDRVNGQVNPKTGLADVLAPLESGPGLLPGAMVRGRIVVRTDPNAVVVPRAAVVFVKAKPSVFVVENAKAHLRYIESGGDDGKLVEVVKGVKAGERVVIEGSAELQDGEAVRIEGGK